MSSGLQKVWVYAEPCQECMDYVDLFKVFDLEGREICDRQFTCVFLCHASLCRVSLCRAYNHPHVYLHHDVF